MTEPQIKLFTLSEPEPIEIDERQADAVTQIGEGQFSEVKSTSPELRSGGFYLPTRALLGFLGLALSRYSESLVCTAAIPSFATSNENGAQFPP